MYTTTPLLTGRGSRTCSRRPTSTTGTCTIPPATLTPWTGTSQMSRSATAASIPYCCGPPTRTSRLDPNLGIDARNQFDYYRALPGGLAALRELVLAFKARGVRVLLAYNPWDQSTHVEGEPHWTTLVRLIKETGADGFNGDTMSTMYREFWDAGVRSGYPIVGEMEGGGYADPGGRPEDASWESASWAPMGWGEGWGHDVALGVDKLKWLDGRHMTHVCDRWMTNHTDNLQQAFFNGVGMESWENVWGIWMHFTERDAEALRRVATLLRWLGSERFVQGYEEWEPYTPDVLRSPGRPFAEGGSVGSRFRHQSGDCAWLVVNRGGAPEEVDLNVSSCGVEGGTVYDLYHGVQLPAGQLQAVRVPVEANGFGAVVLTGRASLPVEPLLARMRGLTAAPLASLSAEWRMLPQEMVGMESRVATTATADGMVLIPRARYEFRSAAVELEGNDTLGMDAQFPWEGSAHRFHQRLLELGPFYIDRHLVTKGDFARFLHATRYAPRDPHNFLVGWAPAAEGGGLAPPAGSERQPVVWVSLAEARRYCAWAGKRLPHAYEWQLAGQGTERPARQYPWGDDELPGRGFFPPPGNGSTVPELPNVGAFSPQGDAPSGVADLAGVVWQYTDEFRDEHTRTVLLKGSGLYHPTVSGNFPALRQTRNWYFPRALELDRHNRMMLMDDAYERAGTLGFRCAADHAEGQAAPYHFRDLGPPEGAGSAAPLVV
ncbi:unnamed protein product [Prorocentrum cordatum]|uniref:Sulfatase-modifying factor enzyme-like domain-containing protein n=1 Tax=Prorocentrum cordatum TaxID=2364126 RepID=A0ABN9QR19_9DINO|nr:unnamed protein product [Polarella glacialis]